VVINAHKKLLGTRLKFKFLANLCVGNNPIELVVSVLCARERKGRTWVAGSLLFQHWLFLSFWLDINCLFSHSSPGRLLLSFLPFRLMIYTFGWHRGSELGTMDKRRRWFHHANASSHNRNTYTCDRTCRAQSQWGSRSRLCSRHHPTGRWLHSWRLIHKLRHLRRRTVRFVASLSAPNHKAIVCSPKLLLHSRNWWRKKKLVWVDLKLGIKPKPD
jgi:hypothetical protein